MNRFLRLRPGLSNMFDPSRAEMLLRKGPNDKPAGVRHDHKLLHIAGGW